MHPALQWLVYVLSVTARLKYCIKDPMGHLHLSVQHVESRLSSRRSYFGLWGKTMQHELVFDKDLIGLEGYDSREVFALIANGDDHFLQYGIAKNSIVVVDPKLPYTAEKLSVFHDPTKLPALRLAKEKLPDCEYRGRVLFAISQFA